MSIPPAVPIAPDKTGALKPSPTQQLSPCNPAR